MKRCTGRITIFTVIFSIVILSGCGSKQGKIIFTFDDDNIADWYNKRGLFDKYDIKATFFVTRPHKLDSAQVQMLHSLQEDGHEIACHTLTHRNAVLYCDTTTIQKYIEREVLPAQKILNEYGFNCTSFAYPNGVSTPELDTALLDYYQILRKATYNKEDTTINYIDRIYSDGNSRVIDAMGIDINFRISLDNFETGLKRISKSGEILMVLAHQINETGGNYSVTKGYLEEAFKLCNKYKIESITCSELYD